MLTFYYHPLSPIARRVWLALLEKEIPFESVIVDLSNREQYQPDFLTLSPFHHIPVIVDEDFHMIESIAILDYLESQYPYPSLLPSSSREQATMRVIQMVTVNELVPKLPKLLNADHVPLTKDIKEQLDTILTFLNNGLNRGIYFGGERLNLADIVVGATVPLFCRLGLELAKYPLLNQWCAQITGRPAWQTTNPSEGDFESWKQWLQRWIHITAKRHARRTHHRSTL